MKRKIKHNDLLPWFTDDHGTLPAAYVKSCQKFFDELRQEREKLQAPSAERQAVAYQNKNK